MKRLIPILVVLAAAGFLSRKYLFPSEEDKIRKVLHEVVQVCHLQEMDSPLDRLSAVKRASGLLAPDARLLVKSASGLRHEFSGKSALTESMTAGQTLVKWLTIDLADEKITVTGDSASVTLTVKAQGKLKDATQDFLNANEVVLGLRKVEGDWKLSSAEEAVVLK